MGAAVRESPSGRVVARRTTGAPGPEGGCSARRPRRRRDTGARLAGAEHEVRRDARAGHGVTIAGEARMDPAVAAGRARREADRYPAPRVDGSVSKNAGGAYAASQGST